MRERIIDTTKNIGAVAIGRQGENKAFRLGIDVSALISEYGDGVATLTHARAGDDAAYPVNTIRDGSLVWWVVEEPDTRDAGTGRLQLIWFVNDVIVKTVIFQTLCAPSLNASEDPPEPWESWVNRIAEYAAECVEATGHYPKIENGRWYVWDVAAEDWTDTGVDAQGPQGNGIDYAELNADYTLTLHYTNGDSDTVGPIRGAKGAKGDTGNGIASAVLNADYTLTLTWTNGGTYTTPSIRGEQGETGETGNGIESIELFSTLDLVDTYVVTFTDGSHWYFDVTNGEKGDTGATGNGIASIAKTGTSGNVDTYTITYTDGTTTTFTVTNTDDPPVPGADGIYGMVGSSYAGEKDKRWDALLPIVDGDETGTNSLLLTDSLAKPVKAFTFTGKSQLGPRLPATYQEVEYVESDGDQYIDTGVAGTLDTSIKAKLSTTSFADANCALGSRTTEGNNDNIGVIFSTINGDSAVTVDFGNYTVYRISNAISSGEAYTVELGKARRAITDSTGTLVAENTTLDANTFTSANNIRLFDIAGGKPSVSTAFVGKLYSCEIYESGTRIRNFVPCYRKADAVIGLYDLVNGVFYTNDGTGTFTKGSDITTFTPTPAVPVPIRSAVNPAAKLLGLNLWDEEWESGTYKTTTGEKAADGNRIRSKNYIRIMPSTKYFNSSSYRMNVCYYDTDKHFISSQTMIGDTEFISPDNAFFICFAVGSSTNPVTTYNHDICINLSDAGVNGTYEPYKAPQTIAATVTLRSVGTAKDTLVVRSDGTGELTQNIGRQNLGLRNWTYITSYGIGLFQSSLFDVANSSCICEDYQTVQSTTDFLTKDYAIRVNKNNANILVRDSRYTDATYFKTAANGIYLYYCLPTPIVTQLTAEEVAAILNGAKTYSPNTTIIASNDSGIDQGFEIVYAKSPAGTYLVNITGETISLVAAKLPAEPSSDGAYHLKLTKSGATSTYSWEGEDEH